MLKIEQIQTSDFVDKYRIKEGLILEVFKYKVINSTYISNLNKISTKIVRGCKGLRILEEDYDDSFRNISVSSGTYIYGNRFVEAISDIHNYSYELKSSGGSVYGNKEDMLEILKTIEEILNNYK